MNVVKKIVREENFLSLIGNLSIAFFGFGGFALLTRSFSVDIFGQWVLFISSGAFIEMFRFGITNTAIIRYLSGVDQDERLKFIGSNGLIGLIATVFIVIILVICHYAFADAIQRAGYELFFTWYPFLAFINLPLNTALVIMQADRKFGKILQVKAINSGGFFAILVANYFYLHMPVLYLVWALLIMNLITSAVCVLAGWDGLRHMRSD